jgi:hypothetical protein
MQGPSRGELVILVRPRLHDDQRYRNEWNGNVLVVLDTHQRVINAIQRSRSEGRERCFFQTSPGGRVNGSAVIGGINMVGESYKVTLVDWHPLDCRPAGRSYGSSFYWAT